MLRLRLFGPPEVILDQISVTEQLPGKAQAILYYLAATGEAQRRPSLASLLWGDMPEAAARTNLRRALVDLRQLLADYLVLERYAIGFKPERNHWADVAEFKAKIGDGSAKVALQTLQEAVDLYRGDFLAGFYVRQAPDFEAWMFAEGEQLRELAIQALYTLADHHRPDQSLSYIRRVLALEGWREEAHRRLMLLLAQSGQRSAALAQFEICRQVLAEELGVEPGIETVTLYQRIRDEDLSQAAEARDLPAEVIQARGSPLSPAAPEPPRHNLPAQTRAFVGREKELGELNRLLAEPGTRLVTIVGPGGMGKTRLAQEAAQAQLNNFTEGVFFVSLASVEAANNIVPTIAEALHFSFYSGRSLRQQLLDYLQSKTMLLVLDNLEHLLDGLELIGEILQKAPRVKILATSREQLKLQAEQLFLIEGIGFPAEEATEEVTQYGAVQLFLKGVQRIQPEFELKPEDRAPVAQICRLVQGMPLALLLAAAWIELLTPAEIAAELGQSLDLLATDWRDISERHRSMRAVFDHSWRLLAEPERETFQQLSVFRGGFTRQAAQEIAGASLWTLRSLVNKSLLHPAHSGRYEVHELLRQYAAEKLEQLPAAYRATCDRHCTYYTTLLKEWQPEIEGPRPQTVLAEMDLEFKNIWAAWNWAARQGQTETIAGALDSLYLFYLMRGRYREGYETLATAQGSLNKLEGPALAPEAAALRDKISSRLGAFCFYLGDYEAAKHQLHAGSNPATLATEQAFAHLILGKLATEQGQHAQAETHFQLSLALYRGMADPEGEAETLGEFAALASSVGDFIEARKRAGDYLAAGRRLGRPAQIARALVILGWATNSLGYYREAKVHWQEALGLYGALGDQAGIADTLGLLGWVSWCLDRSNTKETFLYYEQALAICRRIGHRRHLIACLGDLCFIYGELGNLEKALQAGQESLRLTGEIGHFDMAAYSLNGLGAATAALGDFRSGRQYLARSLQLGLETKILDHLAGAIFYSAQLLAQESSQPAMAEPARQAQQAKALELLEVVLHEPACWQAIKDRATDLKLELEARLPPEVITAATSRGQARNLWATAEELQAELDSMPEA